MKLEQIQELGGLVPSEAVLVPGVWKKPIKGQIERVLKKYTELRDTDGKREAFDSEAEQWVDIQEAISKTSESKSQNKKDFHFLNFEEHREFTIGVVRPAFDEMEKILTAKEGVSMTAQLISFCLRLEGKDGKHDQKLTYEQACRLEYNLAQAFVKSISEVNNLEIGKEKK